MIKYGSRIFFGFWLLVFSNISQLEAKGRTLKGRVIDAEQNTAVPRAAIFITASTFGGFSDKTDGTFELSKMPKLPFDLIVTAIGYENTRLRIDKQM